ncbi:MAG: lipoprotein signal peptidase [Bacteroidales bacterium]|nr:lipoprotein signal peptidase [Candidatus Cryptobacteroides onthequi]
MKKLSRGSRLLIMGILLVVIDQVIKVLVKMNMSIGDHFSVIGNWFQIFFIENEGMAFGMKFGGFIGKYFLTTFRICLFCALTWWIWSLDRKKQAPAGVLVGLSLIDAGALGNIIDCLFYGLIFSPHMPFMQGRVVDMFYFPLIDTTWPQWLPIIGGSPFTFFDPVFNFADSCVTVGAFYLILFHWRFFAAEEEKKETK